MSSRAKLRSARDEFADLLRRRDSPERDWQRLFTEHPIILSESLPLRLVPTQIVPLGRPGRSEPDFLIYPEPNVVIPSSYGVIELKRPSTPILSSPRNQVLKLSGDADTAFAQAKLYATQLTREIHGSPQRLVVVGSRAHIFLIVGHSDELREKVITDIQKEQFDNLLPGGVELLPYDTLYGLFSRRVPPRVHVVIPSTYGANVSRDTSLFATISTVFLSYARPDSEFAARLVREFDRAGIRVWDYRRDLRAGSDLVPELRKALESSSNVVMVLSEAAGWRDAVNWELMETLDREAKRRRSILIPVALDTSWLQSPLGFRLRDRQFLDFSRWQNPTAFRKSFRRLVTALQIAPSE